MIKALFKFTKGLPEGPIIIDTTSGSGPFRDLSPFILPAPPARNLENLWQFSKVYPHQVDKDEEPNEEWYNWRKQGWNDSRAHRYPRGKGAIPLYSLWQGKHLNYIEARKQIYAPEYARNVVRTEGFKELEVIYKSGDDIILLDYDAYDHIKLDMMLIDVINEPRRKMGHAFVLVMMLTGKLEECINS